MFTDLGSFIWNVWTKARKVLFSMLDVHQQLCQGSVKTVKKKHTRKVSYVEKKRC